MKKNHLFLFLILGSNMTTAQNLTQSDIGFQIGENFSIFQSAYQDPGSNGTGVTWDLSAMNGQLGQIDVTVSTNNTSNLPNSNILIITSSGPRSYLNLTNTLMETVGSEYGGEIREFTDPQTMLTFPFTSSTDFTDTFVSNSSGLGGNISGSIHVEFSGSGTLITPAGTFTDVVRVKQTRIQNYTSNSMPQVDTAVAYLWYKAGIHYQLAFVQSIESTVNDLENGYYTSAANLSTEENHLFYVDIYPNPASENIYIKSDGRINDLKIYHLSGELILEKEINDSPVIDLNTADLNSGIYFIHFFDENGTSCVKRFTKN